MPRELRLTSRAESDLAAAFDWYENRALGLGSDLVRRLEVTLGQIYRNPQLNRRRHQDYRLAMTTRFPYAIYYVWDEAADRITVRRILHFAQNAPPNLLP